MGSPLIFVRDGRTLPYFPVTHNALNAIALAAGAHEDRPRRLAAARSLYLALLELANRTHSERVPASRRRLGEMAGISRDLVSDVRPILERALVVQVAERFHDGQQTEHEWVICEPPEQADEMPESRHPLAERQGVVADSQGGVGALPHRSKEGEEELQEKDSLRSSSSGEVEKAKKLRSDPAIRSLCAVLAERMRANDPKAKVAPDSVGWMDAAEKLMRIDERHFEEAMQVLEFSQQDPFWSGQILSMQNFRKKYPSLRAKWLNTQVRSAAAAQPQATVAELMAAYERPRARTGV